MAIDRSNYEIWVIDWLDGNLGDLQTKELLSFLDNNPDLMEEIEALSFVHLNQQLKPYSRKDRLKKSSAEIPDSQFEYLCIGHYEHDLNAEQEKDLEEIVAQIPERKKLFESFQKIVLLPPEYIYNKKNILKKKTTGHNIFRLPVTVLSAAATIALIITSYLLIPGRLQNNTPATTKNRTPDTLIINSVFPIHLINNLSSNYQNINNKKREVRSPEIEAPVVATADSTFNAVNIERIQVSGHLVPFISGLDRVMINYNLISYNYKTIDVNDDDRNKVMKFLARTYRGLILKEEKATDLPLKGYEFVEGGINGINKLLGWEMTLQKTNDKNGELQSFYFSSGMLKFNSPVKK